ncbi:sensor histidine kinase [[Acholeplasma] multilocale]|uniref:sensor histidine kinase n=1 Tax=[Acholeplasma] multilocale TaxID=264638 RepID=UPI00047BDE6D|nr:sensor histidine kinase [[Acholeplasma] multilocale]
MKNNMKKVLGGDTLIWARPEKDIIYLISEFIDNSKSSYEQMIKEGNEGRMPIDITFDQSEGYISIKDLGKGFDIESSIEKIGRDEVQTGQTNQYFVGMKSAMNYFGDYSILVSEREIDGEMRNFANIFIYRNGLLDGDVELESEGNSGSRILMFKDYSSAKQFWRNLKFKQKNDAEKFPEMNDLDDSQFVNYSNTMKILDKIKEAFPLISASLFKRYSPLVNEYDQISINFNCLDYNKNNLLLNNANGIKIGSERPEFLKTISKNNFSQSAAFSFEEFRKKNISLYKKIENDEIFGNEWKGFIKNSITSDMKRFFIEIKKNIFSEEEKEEVSNIPNGFLINKNPLEKYGILDKKISLPDLDNYPLAQMTAEIFTTMFFEGKGTFSDLEFTIDNLIIDESRKILTTRYSDEEDSFPINFTFNLASAKMNSPKFSETFGNFNVDKITGFELIQNNRAIYHGPNLDGVSFSGNPMPENMIIKELREATAMYFPKSWTKISGTEVLVGGNVSKYTSKIFGSIRIRNDSNFESGTNKSQTTNLDILKDYLLKKISEMGMSVLAKWVHMFENNFPADLVTNASKYEDKIKEFKRLGVKNVKIIKDLVERFIYEQARVEVENSGVRNEEGSIDIESLNAKVNNLSLQAQKELDSLVEIKIANDYVKKELVQDFLEDESEINNFEDVLKYIERLLKDAKKNSISKQIIKQVEVSKEENKIGFEIKGNAFSNWEKWIIIELNENEEEILEYIIEDGESIKISLPILINKYDQEVLDGKINSFISELLLSILDINGFFKIAKRTLKLNGNKLNETIESELDRRFSAIEKKIF